MAGCDQRGSESLVSLRLVCAAMVVMALHCWCGPAISATVDSHATVVKPPPLVNADEELAGFLEQAQSFIERGAYGRAIEILQAMILRSDGGFVASPDGRHFVALWRKANDVLGSMDAEGLKLYRTLYDSQAQRLYQKACETGDITTLRRVAYRHMHTTVAPKALAMLAAIHFDRAEFAQAARCWRQALKLKHDGKDEALILARAAAAGHLAGQAAHVQMAVKTLKQRFAKATAVLGGREQNLLEFVARVREMPIPSGVAPRAKADWPGLGGIPDGMATMSECDVVLSPAWQAPKAVHSGRVRPGDLVALRRLLGMPISSSSRYMMLSSRGGRVQATARSGLKLRNGHVFIEYRYGNQAREIAVPAMLHPVVVGDTVICRTDSAVVGYSLLTGGDRRTGKPLWEAKLPMEKSGAVSVRAANYGRYVTWLGDNGRYMLTVGGGKVFALCDYLPGALGPFVRAVARPGTKTPLNTSSLVALSIKDQGARIWKLPGKQAKDEVITNGKFVSPPTYADGRLYVIVKHLESYYLLCLNGDTGRMVWKVSIAQTPAMPRRSGYYYGLGNMTERCSPPAVADGRVFALTNAGAIAAFDTDGGRPIWAYQYESDINSGRYPYVTSVPQNLVYMPPNPIIIAQGRAVFLPADGKRALGLAVDDGKPLWAAPANRMGQRHLSAIDSERVLLSGPRLTVLSSITGKVLHDSSAAKEVHGRPAVTQKAVYASGPGKIYRLSLEDYALTSSGLADASGLLGNLVSVKGKLIAANVLGLSAYFNYDQVREEISSHVAEAQPGEKADMLFQLVRLSFNAKRFARTLGDIEDCRKVAGELGDSLLGRQLQTWEYRTYVALGNRADSPEKMLAMFNKAQLRAETKQAKAHMLVRLAKCREKTGDLVGAVALAQEIAEKYGDEDLVDLQIGADADMSVRFGPDAQRYAGKNLAQRYIKRLIEIHGGDIYAKFDRKAKLALAQAKAKVDPEAMATVAARWPHSEWSDDALLSAAEVYYRQAGEASSEKAKPLMQKAVEHLREVAHMSDSPLYASANLALAVVYARVGWPTVARICCDRVKSLPPDTVVAFAEIKGKLGEVIKRVEAGSVGLPIKVELSATEAINPPLRKVFEIQDVKAFILRDQEFRPVRLASNVFVVRGNRVLMLDLAAENAEKATKWSGLTAIDADALLRITAYNPGYKLIGALSADRKVVLVADRAGMTGLDVGSGKVVWQKKMTDVAVTNFYGMSAGDGALVVADGSGKLTCIEVATGQLRWRATVVGGHRAPIGPPVIRQGLVLVQHDRYQRLACFDLVTGKVIGRWQGKRVQGHVSREGLLVTMVDGMLSVLDRGQMSSPLWSKKYPANQYPAVLAVQGRAVVVSPASSGGTVEVLSSTGGGRLLASLKAAKIASFGPIAVDAAFDGSNVYVTYSMTTVGRIKSYFGRTSTCRGMSIQKFDLSGRRLWSRHIDTGPQSYYYCLPTVIGKNHLIVTARQASYTRPSHVHVLTSNHGREVEQIDLRGAIGPPTLVYRMASLGPPVLAHGRLCVETGKGITVYGER